MKVLAPVLVTGGAVVAMLAVSAWAAPHVPAMAAVHWGLNGRPDGYASRLRTLLMLPALTLVVGLGRAILPAIMPVRAGLERSAAAYTVTWMAAMVLLLVVHAALLLRAAGAPVDIPRLAVAACSALALVTGNVMGKVRYGYVMGLRTPWTLASERVWDKTHRLLGPMIMAFGVAGLLLAAANPPSSEMLTLFIAFALAPMTIATVYAFMLSRRLEARGEA